MKTALSRVALLAVLGLGFTLPAQATLNPEASSVQLNQARQSIAESQPLLLARRVRCGYVYYRVRGRIYRQMVCTRR
jgi:hypothetical protein